MLWVRLRTAPINGPGALDGDALVYAFGANAGVCVLFGLSGGRRQRLPQTEWSSKFSDCGTRFSAAAGRTRFAGPAAELEASIKVE